MAFESVVIGCNQFEWVGIHWNRLESVESVQLVELVKWVRLIRLDKISRNWLILVEFV